MKKLIYNLAGITLILLLTNCAPKEFVPPQVEPLVLPKTEQYNIQDKLAGIPKPLKLQPIFVKVNKSNNSFTIVNNASDASHILLAPEEYAKVGAVIKIALAYKEIVIDHETLVNQFINRENLYKDLLMLERQKTMAYRDLWAASENMYRNESYDHKMDNLINRTTWILTGLGSLTLLLLAL